MKEFTEEYTQEVLGTLKYHPNIQKIRELVSTNDFLGFQFQLEFIKQDLEALLTLREIQDDGDRLVWNSQVSYYYKIKSLYNEFLQWYTEEPMLEPIKEANG